MAEHANTFLLLPIFMLMTALMIFGMKYFSATRQAGQRVLREDTYRKLAEQAAAAHSSSTALLSTLQTDLFETKTRLSNIERLLKEVE